MIWDTIKNFVSPIAPVIGAAIGGPVGTAAGLILKKVLLDKEDASDEDLLKVLQGLTPDQLLALKQADYNFVLEMQRILSGDRVNAREREIALAQAGIRDKTPAYLAYFLTLGVFISLGYLFTYSIPNDNKDLIISIVSAMVTVWIGAMGYYHGSTSGSREKDKYIRH